MTFTLDKDYKDAFHKLKDLLTIAPIIQPPNWNLPFKLMCNVSDNAIGAALGQRVDKNSHAKYYVSRNLSDAQLNYSTMKKKLLLVIFSIDKF